MPQALSLDPRSLDSKKLSMATLKHEINQAKKPNWVLRKLMNTLEQKRMVKKLGWSRPWNKYGVNNFRTHTLNFATDQEYIQNASEALSAIAADSEMKYQSFLQELLADSQKMGFVFYHNITDEDGSEYEGLTISFGRKVSTDKTRRDRVDIILEDKRENGKVDQKIDRIRVYINPLEPFMQEEEMLVKTLTASESLTPYQDLYNESVKLYHEWKEDDERLWFHWAIRYIDYFGARSFIPENTCFD